jgi:hypothetical protein
MLDGIVAAPEQRSPSFPQSAIAPILSRPASELFPLRLRLFLHSLFSPMLVPSLSMTCNALTPAVRQG